jgi:hypothetical protein
MLPTIARRSQHVDRLPVSPIAGAPRPRRSPHHPCATPPTPDQRNHGLLSDSSAWAVVADPQHALSRLRIRAWNQPIDRSAVTATVQPMAAPADSRRRDAAPARQPGAGHEWWVRTNSATAASAIRFERRNTDAGVAPLPGQPRQAPDQRSRQRTPSRMSSISTPRSVSCWRSSSARTKLRAPRAA